MLVQWTLDLHEVRSVCIQYLAVKYLYSLSWKKFACGNIHLQNVGTIIIHAFRMRIIIIIIIIIRKIQNILSFLRTRDHALKIMKGLPGKVYFLEALRTHVFILHYIPNLYMQAMQHRKPTKKNVVILLIMRKLFILLLQYYSLSSYVFTYVF